MHLTLFTDYALRSLIYLSAHGDRPCTVEEISGYFNISADHVTKVMQHLARQGYVRSRRGRHGGAMLARRRTIFDWAIFCATSNKLPCWIVCKQTMFALSVGIVCSSTSWPKGSGA